MIKRCDQCEHAEKCKRPKETTGCRDGVPITDKQKRTVNLNMCFYALLSSFGGKMSIPDSGLEKIEKRPNGAKIHVEYLPDKKVWVLTTDDAANRSPIIQLRGGNGKLLRQIKQAARAGGNGG